MILSLIESIDLSGKPNSPVVARCSFYKHKEKIMKERSKLKGSSIFIAEDFSQRVRGIRKALTPHLKTDRNQGKRDNDDVCMTID